MPEDDSAPRDTTALYEGLGAAYDAMVDWAGRLEREWPFLSRYFEAAGVRTVLDVGCGTGGHAIRFAQAGLQVVGADPSQAMVAQARKNSAGISGVEFIVAGFGHLQETVGSGFDAVTCLGNTLPHVLSAPELRATLQDIRGVLRPGGLLILQQLNYDRIISRRQRYLGVSSGQENGREILFFRFYDYGPELLTFNMVTFRRQDDGSWIFDVYSSPMRPIQQSELLDTLRKTGFGRLETFGDYQGHVFDPETSNDLVVVAWRD